ncbi:hypothetical protein SAMN04488005_2478 [Yoonia tamlensis]|uniref:Flagellar FliJ protein n=1 Tax=Yoonia tamlensis TaxID=390270 RepID=A0A1I6HBI9_9RHOB|nr:hypothetical protein [Yoonia tamlensis]SFR51839.1 hypothetical protein SAMN04488005_2478 [Yoonia tamlensis]
MTRIKQAKALAELTSISLHAAQAKMAALVTRETGLRENLAQLVQQRDQPGFAPGSMVDAALAAGANVRWQHWVDQRRRVINTELAQVLALKSQYHAQLGQAFGRDQAAKSVIDRLEKTRMTIDLRRKYYES